MRLTIPELLPDTIYEVEFQGKTQDALSNWSRKFIFTTVAYTTLPKTPTAPTVTTTAGDSYVINFLPVTTNVLNEPINLDRYELELTGVNQAGTVVKYASVPPKLTDDNIVSYVLDYQTNLGVFGNFKTSLSVRIRAVDKSGNFSNWSPTGSATIQKPKKPVIATATTSGDSFVFAYTPVTQNEGNQDVNIERYEVEYTAGGVSKYVTINKTSTSTTVNCVLDLATNISLFGTPAPSVTARLRAISKTEVSSDWSDPTTVTNAIPEPPTSPVATGVNSGISVTWNSSTSTDVKSYKVYASTSSSLTDPVLIFEGMANTTLFNTVSPNPYYFGIYAVDTFNQLSNVAVAGPATALSPFAVDTTPPNPPTNALFSSSFDTSRRESSITVSWTASTSNDVQNYVVRYGPSSTGPWTYRTVDKESTSITDVVTSGQVYYAQVRASDWSGNYSAWVNPTPTNLTAGQDGVAPPTLAAPTVDVVGSSFVIKWAASTAADLKEYEVGITYSGGTEVTYKTTNTRLDFTFDMNRAAFTTPQPIIVARVRAIDIGGLAGTFSSTTSATNSQPNPPTGLTGTVGANSISIGWTPTSETDIVSYNIYMGTTVNPTTKIATVDSTNYTVSVTDTTPRYFRVCAVDAFGQIGSALSGGPYTATNPFLVDNVAPPVPTGLNVFIANKESGEGAMAEIYWSSSGMPTDLAGYKIRFVESGSFAQYIMIQIPKGTTSTRTELPLAFQNYDFQISAYDLSGNSSAWSTKFVATSLSPQNPGNVENLVGVSNKGASITYTWDQVLDQTLKNYELQFSSTSDFSSSVITYRTGTATTLTVSGLSSLTTYYARVRAVNNTGQSSLGWSNTATNTTTASTAVSFDDIIAGTIGNGVGMTMAPGSSILLNGGHIRSSTYDGGTSYSETATAGFYAGNDGLVIAQGRIKAEAFAGGNFSSGIINIAAGGSITGAGGAFVLDANGLTVPNGSIKAVSLDINVGGENLVVGSDFENQVALFEDYGAAGTEYTTTDKWQGDRSLRYNPAGGAFRGIILWSKERSYLNLLQPNTQFVGSVYFKGSAGSTYRFEYRYRNDVVNFVGEGDGGPDVVATGDWQRVKMPPVSKNVAVIPGIQVFYVSGPGGGDYFYIDAAKIELGNIVTAWSPSGTNIEGDRIRTGALYSNTTGTDGQPLWSIPLNGSATFQNLLVKGQSVLGNANDANTWLQSYGYTSGSTGWRIAASGSAEFNDVTVRGNIQGNANSTIIGGSFKTAANTGVFGSSGGPGILINSSGISAYYGSGPSGPRKSFSVDASAGTVTMGGSNYIQGNSYVSGNTELGGTLTVKGGITVSGDANSAYIRGGGFTGTASSGATGNGYILDTNGLYIGDNSTVQAGALKIQAGAANLLPAEWSTFELPASFYNFNATPPTANSSGTITISTARSWHGTQSVLFNITAGTSSGNDGMETQAFPTTPVTGGKTYIVSAYVYQVGNAPNDSRFRMTYYDSVGNAGNPTSGGPQYITQIDKWVRLSWYHTVDTNATWIKFIPRFSPNTAASNRLYYLDAVQIEEKMAGSNTPSTFSITGLTSVDGDIIKTGAIRSNNYSPGVSGWSINTNGAAEFNGGVTSVIMIGAKFKTDAAENKGVLIDTTGIKAYGPTQNITFQLDSSNGGIQMFGGILTGAKIQGSSSIEIANIKINATDGFKATLNDGIVQIPANGADPTFWGNFVSKSLTIPKTGTGIFQGVISMPGVLRPSNGVSDPISKISADTFVATTNSNTVPGGSEMQGFTQHNNDANYFVSAYNYGPSYYNPADGVNRPYYTGSVVAMLINKNTGATSWLFQANNIFANGIVQLGGYYYMVGVRYDYKMYEYPSYKTHGTWVFKFDSVGNLVGQIQLIGEYGAGEEATPTIGTDGSQILIARANGNDSVYVRRLNTSLQLASTSVYNTFANIGGSILTSYNEGNFDFGASRGVFTIYGGANFVINTANGDRLGDAYIWAPEGGASRGMLWHSGEGRFYSLGLNGYIYKHATGAIQTQTLYAGYTWYDGNSTGGTHETKVSPVLSFSRPARKYLSLNGVAAPGLGESGSDAANLVRIWVGTSSTNMRLQFTLPASGQSGVVYEGLNLTGGTGPAPTASNFGELGTIGSIESEKKQSDGTTPKWAFKGNGETVGLGGIILTGNGGNIGSADPPSATTGSAFTATSTGWCYATINASGYGNAVGGSAIWWYIDGVYVGQTFFYFNTTSEHHTLNPAAFKVYLTKGVHYLWAKRVNQVLTDANDQWSLIGTIVPE